MSHRAVRAGPHAQQDLAACCPGPQGSRGDVCWARPLLSSAAACAGSEEPKPGVHWGGTGHVVVLQKRYLPREQALAILGCRRRGLKVPGSRGADPWVAKY